MADFNDFKKDLDKLIKNVENSKLDRIGKFVADMIRKRTRLGYGVATGSRKKEKLKALSDGYKDFRKRNPPKGPSTPSKSNLTYTGEMLEAIAYKAKKLILEVGIFDGEEAEKAFWNMLQGREFLNLSEAEIAQVTDLIEKLIDDEFKKM